ncbi:myosin-binding protein 1-like [Tasmannia lanceolata]|uniref:myosin-binding protein 1-like n=1 Tax=Tasmannia lanceolata TaxID=3420 RepID=UPI004064439A
MAARRNSVRIRSDSQKFTSVLVSAVLEWLLIFLLFLDAIFSYLVTKFAHFCELQAPCLLCSRLDHIFGSEKPGFYKDLLCGAHKLEISSLGYCRIHDKLADVCGICEGCLFSFATEKKSNSETYKSLLGKLGQEIGFCADDDHHSCLELPAKEPSLKNPTLDSRPKRHCSCCNEPLKSKTYTHRVLERKSTSPEVAELDFPLSGSMGDSLDDLKKRKKSSGSSAVSYLGNSGFDPLSHIGYTELKITSDSESEVMISDDEGGSLARGTSDLKQQFLAQCESFTSNPNILPKTLNIDLALEKLIHQAPISESSISISQELLNIVEPRDVPNLESGVAIRHGFEEINWNKVEEGTKSPSLSGLISPTSRPSSPTVSEAPVKLSEEKRELHIVEPHVVSTLASDVAVGHGLEELNWNRVEEVAKSPLLSGLISPTAIPSSPPVTEAPVEVSEKKLDVIEIGDMEHVSTTESRQVFKPESDLTSIKSVLKANETLTIPGPSVPSYMDLNDAYKLAVGDKGSHPSGSFTELFGGKDSSRVHEDLKVLLSQISAARGFELSWNDMSPRVPPALGDDSKASDTSGSIDLQMLHKRLSIERNESGIESLDGSIVSEIEGETATDRLKRQMALDRKSMRALYKELEEERSASTIAANQAMAMITRLQEEKAAMQMEALQYQRMMEEQAEYDQEALQKLNDVLAEREKEIQDLEPDIETYRKRFETESMEKKDLHESNTDFSSNSPLVKKSVSSNNFEQMDGDREGNKVGILKDSFLDFEDEKVYISKCLKRLEERLHLFSNNGVYVDISRSGAEIDGFSDKKCDDIMHRGSDQEQDQILLQDNIPGNDGPSRKEGLKGNHMEQHHWNELGQGNNQIEGEDFDGKCPSMDFKGEDLVSIECEVSQLSERLQTLEADQNFLEHTMNSLRNGIEGIQFIQEIASHLRELRRIGIRRDQHVA